MSVTATVSGSIPVASLLDFHTKKEHPFPCCTIMYNNTVAEFLTVFRSADTGTTRQQERSSSPVRNDSRAFAANLDAKTPTVGKSEAMPATPARGMCPSQSGKAVA